jgi:Rrf2 family protein
MKLTRSSAIAVYAVTYIADATDKDHCQGRVIAAALGVPQDTLIKILQQLARARILASVRGRAGGFRLAKPADRVTLLAIVEAIEGPLDHGPPLTGVRGMRRAERQMDRTLVETGQALRRILAKTTVGDLRQGRTH